MASAPWAASSCLLPSFERSAGDGGSGGGSGRGGAGAVAGAEPGPGGEGGGAGAGAGEGGQAGAHAGGEGGAAGARSPVVLTAREYWTGQGNRLERDAEEGLLSEDRDDGWTRVAGRSPRGSDTDPARPAEYDAYFRIEADGAFSFEPAPEFFGAYEVRYEAENESGDRAQGTLRVHVRPSAVTFASLTDGIGGYAVAGPRDEGFGSTVAAAGDVDGDGFGDFLIGAPLAEEDAGAVYVVFGRQDARSFSALVEPGDQTHYARVRGTAGGRLGSAVASAGDANGDGLADVLVGAPGAPLADGAAYLLYGRARSAWSGSPEIETLVADGGGRVFRGAPSDNAGVLLAGGSDLSGDGEPDLLIAAQHGRARFYVVGAEVDAASVDLETLTPLLGAGQEDTALGMCLPGDLTGDRRADLFVGTRRTLALVRGYAADFPEDLGENFEPDRHGLLLARGTATGALSVTAAGDFDGDGGADLAYCDEALAEPCRVVASEPTDLAIGTAVGGLAAGPALVAGGGETSGDDRDDLIFADTEKAYVVYGRERPGESLALDALGDAGFRVSGARAIISVALGGELDRALTDDGRGHFFDWLIGDSDPDTGEGRVYVLFGGPYSD